MSIYVKTPEGWEPLVEGSLEGTPGQPTIANLQGGSVVQFGPGAEGSAGPTIAYGAYINPSGDGATVEVDQETLEATVSGTEPFVDYVLSIYGVNVAGKGEPVSTFPFQMNYNEATGGTETVVDDYNGTGEQWAVHTFTSSEAFEVASSSKPFHTMVVGGGGSGAGGSDSETHSYGGGGGGSGEVQLSLSTELTPDSYAVSIGAGNASTTLGSVITAISGTNGASCGGGASGNGFAGGGCYSNPSNKGAGGGGGSTGPGSLGDYGGRGGGPPTSSDIAGTGLVSYSGGGGGGGSRAGGGSAGGQGVGPGGGGRGGGAVAQGAAAGTAGIVVIAYQIGVSSTTQIKNAQAKQAARSQGHDDGYAEGFSEGYVDFEMPTYADEDTE